MKQYQIIISDLDGTLIKTRSGEIFPKGIWDMQLRFDVLDKIKEMSPKYVLIASNQGSIERGLVIEDNFAVKAEYIGRAIEEYCECECYCAFCPSNDGNYYYRKPNTGMLDHLIESYVGDDFDYIKTTCLMIGDASGKPGQFSDSDKKTAENFGCDYMDVDDFIKL